MSKNHIFQTLKSSLIVSYLKKKKRKLNIFFISNSNEIANIIYILSGIMFFQENTHFKVH